MDRTKILGRVQEHEGPWDIIVIGGGATGVGCAVDAATRGLDVLLLEQHDFGKGTSSRSTKLVHGGVRYLAQGNLSLVRESLRERGILLKNAPHVVHKQAFVVPCYSNWQNLFYGLGLKIYDLLSGKYSFGRSRILSRQETLERLPGIKPDGLSGGILYFDGQFDDTRLLIDLVRTADKHGAAVLNYAKVNSLAKDEDGKVSGVVFEDIETGKYYVAKAKVVINATGAFCEAIRKLSDDAAERIVTLSQGIHLVFDRKFMPGDNALMIPKTSDGRVLFCIPWHGQMLVGTTDTPTKHAKLEPIALDTEIEFILKTAGEYLKTEPEIADIQSIFAGIRPLIKSGSTKDTVSLSRGHTIVIDKSDLLTVTGGKWTTYRRMAEDAVDMALKLVAITGKSSRTKGTRIHGYCENAGDYSELSVYGADAEKIQNIIEENPDLAEKLHPDLPYCKAEIVWCVRNEMARNVEDVLARRTRALFINAWATTEIAPMVAGIMSAELGKSEDWAKKQARQFVETAKNYLPS